MASTLISGMARTIGVAGMPMLKRAAGKLTRWVPIPQPVLLVGPASSAELGQSIADFGHRRVLLVTDASIAQLGLAKPLLRALAAAGIGVATYDGVTPDSPLPVLDAGVQRYRDEGCDGIVAVGGGSVMDAAKVIGLAAANQRRPRDLVGYFRAGKSPPPLYAVPTTAGTGSEVTVAAVISDPKAGRKMLVVDLRIVPEMAALDPKLMTALPPAVTAATGMDALTHAVEAFIGNWATPQTDRLALAAVGMIWKYLPRAYAQGTDLLARERMALASTYAGLAFTRANVGNVHAIAHQLGGRYHVPHGLANAILLPPVLRFSLASSRDRLAALARHVGLNGRSDQALADAFCAAVQRLNQALGIPAAVAELREADIAALAQAACDEADLNYPVPRRMAIEDCEGLLREVLPKAAQRAGAPRRRSPS